MSFDNALLAISLIGIFLSLFHFWVAYRQLRSERAMESRRLDIAREVSHRAVPVADSAVRVDSKQTCTVLDFKGAGARKARDAQEVDADIDSADMEDSRQRGGRTV